MHRSKPWQRLFGFARQIGANRTSSKSYNRRQTYDNVKPDRQRKAARTYPCLLARERKRRSRRKDKQRKNIDSTIYIFDEKLQKYVLY